MHKVPTGRRQDSSSVFSETHRFGRAGVGGASEASRVFFEILSNQEEYCFGLLIMIYLEIDYNFKFQRVDAPRWKNYIREGRENNCRSDKRSACVARCREGWRELFDGVAAGRACRNRLDGGAGNNGKAVPTRARDENNRGHAGKSERDAKSRCAHCRREPVDHWEEKARRPTPPRSLASPVASRRISWRGRVTTVRNRRRG
jgi:hypothetical protein